MFDNGLCLAPGKAPVDIVKVINRAYADRFQLSAAGYYATPDIYYDVDKGRGKPPKTSKTKQLTGNAAAI